MKTLTRTCANCAFFNQDPIDDLPVCWNLIRFTVNVGTPQEFIRDPVPTDKDCSQHQTHAESAMEDEFIFDCVDVGGPQIAELALQATALARATIRKARGA